VSVNLVGSRLTLDAQWREPPPFLKIAVPGFKPIDADPSDRIFQLQK
jgi:hypothetical protein